VKHVVKDDRRIGLSWGKLSMFRDVAALSNLVSRRLAGEGSER
jgi:hypothetical protein